VSSAPRPGLQLPNILYPVLPRLLAEHGGVLSAETVLCCLASCHDELHRAGVRAGLNHAAEAMARARLRHSPATYRALVSLPDSDPVQPASVPPTVHTPNLSNG
jgi:hypothetical protein